MRSMGMIETVVGIIVAVLVVILAQKRGLETWLYSASLLILPAVYIVFGIFSTGEHVMLKEFLYGLPFIVAGILGLKLSFRFSAYLIAIFWLAHAVYDLAHGALFVNNGVPGWYPLFCAVVDFLVGAYLIYLARRLPNSNLKLGVSDG